MSKVNQVFESSEQNTKKKRFLMWVLLLLILLIGATVYHTFFRVETIPVSVTTGDFLPEGKDASKMTDQEVKKYAQSAVDQNKFNMKIVSHAKVDSKTMESGIMIQNPPSNQFPVNVVITDNQTGHKLYSSGAIQPGEEIKGAQLEKSLELGSHKATATFHLYDPITKQEKGQLKSGLTLTVSEASVRD